MRAHVLLLIVVAVAGGAGCSKGKSDPGSGTGTAASAGAPEGAPPAAADPAAQAAPAAAEPPATGEAEPAGAAVAPIDEAAVRQVVDGWLAAQNAGDFTAYRALYAGKFLGIKRIGPRAFKYDGAGWLGDRERMFKKSMKVEVEDLEITSSPQTAVVTFTQTWSSGSYQDVGPKQLVVVREGEALRIGREEMLSSLVVGTAARPGALDPAALAFVIAYEGATYVVLDPAAEPSWATGKPTLVTAGGTVVVKKAAKGLPAPLAAWQGRQVSLFGAAGKTCDGTIAEVLLLARVEPHFGTMQDWSGDPDVSDRGKASPARIAREAWDMGGSLVLAGRVSPTGDCGVAQWARATDSTAPAPATVVTGPAATALGEAALTRFRALPAWKDIQAGYGEEVEQDKIGMWDEHEEASPTVVVFQDARPERTYVAIAVMAGEGCGSFYGELWAVWAVEGGTWILMSDPKEPGEYFLPAAAVDADGDGTIELIGSDTILRAVDGVYRATDNVKVPNFDCPC